MPTACLSTGPWHKGLYNFRAMTNQTYPEQIPLRTRKFSCFFEPSTGFLRRVKTSGVEVIRSIYGAVRDKNWDTIEPRLKIERVEQGDDSFCLEFAAHHEDEPIRFSWKGVIEGRGGVLEFRFDGRAQNSFLRNRIGLCTLHPIVECAGKACQVQHSDGSWEEGAFPLFISPHQPFKDILALSWNPSERVHADIQFEGEVFEMEDQRNWTDASFKTYSTPLELPFPVELARGEEIRQRAILTLVTEEQNISTTEERRVEVAVSSKSEARQVAQDRTVHSRPWFTSLVLGATAFGASPLKSSAGGSSLLGFLLENCPSSGSRRGACN